MRPKTPSITPTTTPINAPVLNDFEDPPELLVADPVAEPGVAEVAVEVVEDATDRETDDDAALRQAVLFPEVTLNKLDFTIPAFSFPVSNASTAYAPAGTSTAGQTIEPDIDDVFADTTWVTRVVWAWRMTMMFCVERSFVTAIVKVIGVLERLNHENVADSHVVIFCTELNLMGIEEEG